MKSEDDNCDSIFLFLGRIWDEVELQEKFEELFYHKEELNHLKLHKNY
jgi:hypothetical protein